MIQNPELAIAGFPAKTFLAATPPVRTNFWIWKFLFVATLFLFAFVTLPKTEARETALSSTNLTQIINQDRIRYGLEPLTENKKLKEAAYAKARDILMNDYFAHVSPAGINPWQFIDNSGFSYAFAGENLAMNYTSAYELEQDFLQSPSHRENLLSPLFTQVGIAVVWGKLQGQNAIVTVQMFASPK